MDEKVYNKLVRDEIPDVIARDGKSSITRTLYEDEYRVRLLEKLDEEVGEFKRSPNLEELADIVEVVDACAVLLGGSLNNVMDIKKDKRAARGGFEGRVFLERTMDL